MFAQRSSTWGGSPLQLNKVKTLVIVRYPPPVLPPPHRPSHAVVVTGALKPWLFRLAGEVLHSWCWLCLGENRGASHGVSMWVMEA